MEGKMTIIKADGTIDETNLVTTPSLDTMQAAVEGYIELVPWFDTYEGEPCVAFCNEEGKLNDLPVNATATEAWHYSIGRPHTDVLVGDVVIFTGDQAFMASL